MATELTVRLVGDAIAAHPSVFTFTTDGVHIARLSRSRKPRIAVVPRQDAAAVLARLGNQPERITLEGRILTEPHRAAHNSTSGTRDRSPFYPLHIFAAHGRRVMLERSPSWMWGTPTDIPTTTEFEIESWDTDERELDIGAPLIIDWRIVFARAG